MIQPTWGRTARPRSSRIGTKNDFSVSPGRTEEPWTTRPLGCTLVTRASKRGVSRLSSSFASHCITDSGIAGGSDHHELPVSEMDDESLCWGALPPGAIHSRGAGGGIGDCSGEDFSYALWTTRLAEENRPMVQQASEMMKLTVVATRQMV